METPVMETPPIESQNYELALHLTPGLNDDEVKQILQDVESRINSAGGLVSRLGEVRMQKLAYPILHQFRSQYVCVEFSALASAIDALNRSLSLQEHKLRHTIVKKSPPVPASAKIMRFETAAKKISSSGRRPEKKVEVKEEELDQKLEEILGKI